MSYTFVSLSLFDALHNIFSSFIPFDEKEDDD